MWPSLQVPTDLGTFTEEIPNGKLHFCAVFSVNYVLFCDFNVFIVYRVFSRLVDCIFFRFNLHLACVITRLFKMDRTLLKHCLFVNTLEMNI